MASQWESREAPPRVRTEVSTSCAPGWNWRKPQQAAPPPTLLGNLRTPAHAKRQSARATSADPDSRRTSRQDLAPVMLLRRLHRLRHPRRPRRPRHILRNMLPRRPTALFHHLRIRASHHLFPRPRALRHPLPWRHTAPSPLRITVKHQLVRLAPKRIHPRHLIRLTRRNLLHPGGIRRIPHQHRLPLRFPVRLHTAAIRAVLRPRILTLHFLHFAVFTFHDRKLSLLLVTVNTLFTVAFLDCYGQVFTVDCLRWNSWRTRGGPGHSTRPPGGGTRDFSLKYPPPSKGGEPSRPVGVSSASGSACGGNASHVAEQHCQRVLLCGD